MSERHRLNRVIQRGTPAAGEMPDSDFPPVAGEMAEIPGFPAPPAAGGAAMTEQPRRTSFAQALADYDEKFATALADAILQTIAKESMVTDAAVLALRTSETAAALVACLATVLALNPNYDVPSRLREAVDQIAKKLRRDVAKIRAAASPTGFLSATREGHA
jgi:hypothetical protein